MVAMVNTTYLRELEAAAAEEEDANLTVVDAYDVDVYDYDVEGDNATEYIYYDDYDIVCIKLYNITSRRGE